jgi:hypothetical protein
LADLNLFQIVRLTKKRTDIYVTNSPIDQNRNKTYSKAAINQKQKRY